MRLSLYYGTSNIGTMAEEADTAPAILYHRCPHIVIILDDDLDYATLWARPNTDAKYWRSRLQAGPDIKPALRR